MFVKIVSTSYMFACTLVACRFLCFLCLYVCVYVSVFVSVCLFASFFLRLLVCLFGSVWLLVWFRLFIGLVWFVYLFGLLVGCLVLLLLLLFVLLLVVLFSAFTWVGHLKKFEPWPWKLWTCNSMWNRKSLVFPCRPDDLWVFSSLPQRSLTQWMFWLEELVRSLKSNET